MIINNLHISLLQELEVFLVDKTQIKKTILFKTREEGMRFLHMVDGYVGHYKTAQIKVALESAEMILGRSFSNCEIDGKVTSCFVNREKWVKAILTKKEIEMRANPSDLEGKIITDINFGGSYNPILISCLDGWDFKIVHSSENEEDEDSGFCYSGSLEDILNTPIIAINLFVVYPHDRWDCLVSMGFTIITAKGEVCLKWDTHKGEPLKLPTMFKIRREVMFASDI